MKLEDLGIDKSGHHNKKLTHAENCFLGLLWIDHVGEENKISADELAIRFYYALLDGRTIAERDLQQMLKGYRNYSYKKLALLKRDVRRIHNHLLTQHDHTPILSKAGIGGGYWVAGSEQEAEQFYDTFRQRGLTGLVKASRGKKAVMVEMMSQLSFEFENMVDKSGIGDRGPGARKDGAPAAIAVVDAFLERMLREPERYSADLRKLGRKFGSVLLPKAQVSAMQAKAQELQEIIGQFTVAG